MEQTMKLDQAVKAAQAVAAAKASGEARAIIDAGRDALAADLDKKLGHTVTGDRCLHALRALCHSGNFRNGAETSGTALHALRALCSQPCTQLHARCTVRLARRVGSGLHRTRVYPGCCRQYVCRLSPPVEMARFSFDRSLVGMASTQLLRWRFA